LFGATIIIGLAAAYRYAIQLSSAPIIQAPTFSFGQMVFLAAAISFFVLAAKGRWGKYVIWTFFVIVIWSGVQVLSDIFIRSSLGIFSGILVLTLFFSWRSVLMHDLTMILALAGIGATIGTAITPTVGIIALIALSFYDIIAVYRTRHMVRLAEGMLKAGAVSGFIIPQDTKGFLTDRRLARPHFGDKFMILGSGDVVFPLIFAASLMRQSLAEAVIVGTFSVIGLLLTHLLFVGQEKRRAMAALPPIATMCLIGYLIALLFNL